MDRTMHNAIRSALIKEAVEKDDFEDYTGTFPSPEKFQRMYKKITGKGITLAEAKQILKGGE